MRSSQAARGTEKPKPDRVEKSVVKWGFSLSNIFVVVVFVKNLCR